MLTRRYTFLLISLAALLSAGTYAAGVPNDAESVRHALNRLTYGPRPDDIERVSRMGLGEWIDQQLHPSTIDDSALERQLPDPPQAVRTDSPKDARREARRAVEDLASARLIRAAASERQLEEMLVDFWFNHFNVFAGKGRTAIYLPEYEREAIRPHVLGRFRDVLEATARSPAMLFYLDNWLSAVKGGHVYGRWPGLKDSQRFEGRDLAVTTDFRDVFTDVITRHLGAPQSTLARVFPGFTAHGGVGVV